MDESDVKISGKAWAGILIASMVATFISVGVWLSEDSSRETSWGTWLVTFLVAVVIFTIVYVGSITQRKP